MIKESKLTTVMRRLHAHDSQVFAIAKRYVQKRLPHENTLNMQTRIVSLLHDACRDYLIRDSADLSTHYRNDAAVLAAALQILNRDDRRFFDSLMISARDIVIGAPEPFRGISSSAGRVVRALETISNTYASMAEDHARDRKNITFYYTLGRAFQSAGRPLPTANLAADMLDLLIAAMRGVVDTQKITASCDLKDIKRRLAAGAAAA